MYYVLWHDGGLTLRDRTKNRQRDRQDRGIGVTLWRLHFKPAANLDLETLTEDGLKVYLGLVNKYHTLGQAEAEAREIEERKAYAKD